MAGTAGYSGVASAADFLRSSGLPALLNANQQAWDEKRANELRAKLSPVLVELATWDPTAPDAQDRIEKLRTGLADIGALDNPGSLDAMMSLAPRISEAGNLVRARGQNRSIADLVKAGDTQGAVAEAVLAGQTSLAPALVGLGKLLKEQRGIDESQLRSFAEAAFSGSGTPETRAFGRVMLRSVAKENGIDLPADFERNLAGGAGSLSQEYRLKFSEIIRKAIDDTVQAAIKTNQQWDPALQVMRTGGDIDRDQIALDVIRLYVNLNDLPYDVDQIARDLGYSTEGRPKLLKADSGKDADVIRERFLQTLTGWEAVDRTGGNAQRPARTGGASAADILRTGSAPAEEVADTAETQPVEPEGLAAFLGGAQLTPDLARALLGAPNAATAIPPEIRAYLQIYVDRSD